jgi:hypothetical protein
LVLYLAREKGKTIIERLAAASAKRAGSMIKPPTLTFSLINLCQHPPTNIASGQPLQRAHKTSLGYGITLKAKRLLIHSYAQLA